MLPASLVNIRSMNSPPQDSTTDPALPERSAGEMDAAYATARHHPGTGPSHRRLRLILSANLVLGRSDMDIAHPLDRFVRRLQSRAELQEETCRALQRFKFSLLGLRRGMTIGSRQHPNHLMVV